MRPASAISVALLLTGCNCGDTATVNRNAVPQVPAVLDFGTVVTGTQHQKSFNVHNAGLRALGVSSASVRNSDGSFSVPGGGFTVAPGSDTPMTVTFDPTMDGQHQGTLFMPVTAAQTSSVSVALQGASYTPGLKVSPLTLDFGQVEVGIVSAPQNVTITDNTIADEGVSVGPVAGSGEFGIGPPNGSVSITQTLTSGQSTTVTVDFAPTHPGAANATLPVLPCPTCAPIVVTLKGVGIPPCAGLTYSPASIDFGSVTMGSSASQSITFDNMGTYICALSAIGISQNDQYNEFGTAPGTPATLMLAPNQQQAVQVTFTPMSTAVPLARAALFTAFSGGPASPQVSVPLGGTVAPSCFAGTKLPDGGPAYTYTCDWTLADGGVVTENLTELCNVTVEGLPDVTLLGQQCLDFQTQDPGNNVKCLDGTSINVFTAPAEYPSDYVVHDGLQGPQCTYGVWVFPQ